MRDDMMRNEHEQRQTLVTIERESIETGSDEEAGLDFFSDAPLDVESAVTGKTCNIFDPECEACQ